MKRLLRRLRADRSGATAVELAIVLPVFLILLLGTISAAQLAWTLNSLHYAVEEAARCSAVNLVDCANGSETEAFARARYLGPDIDATFVADSPACGRRVRVEGEFELMMGVTIIDVPLAAEACYPAVEEA